VINRRPSVVSEFPLFAIALVSVISWLYWHGWPRYQMHLRQMKFEAAVRENFRPGRTAYDGKKFGELADTLVGGTSDAKGNSVVFIRREWPNVSYVIYGPLKPGRGFDQMGVAFEGVEVFRLAPVPRGYLPQTDRGKRAVAKFPKGNSLESPESLAYRIDFIEMLGGDRRDDLGIEYELIHFVPSVANDSNCNGKKSAGTMD
jgi:hypothetical protein